jgi:hypothetical protein
MSRYPVVFDFAGAERALTVAGARSTMRLIDAALGKDAMLGPIERRVAELEDALAAAIYHSECQHDLDPRRIEADSELSRLRAILVSK